MRFDTPAIENQREAEQHLHHQLLSYGSVPGLAEQHFGISRFFAVGWRQYEGSRLYISFTKITPQTTLIAEATIYQCPDDPTHFEFQSFVRAPDGLVLKFPESCPTYANEIERTIMGDIECYISHNPRTEAQEIFKRYRIGSNPTQRTHHFSQR